MLLVGAALLLGLGIREYRLRRLPEAVPLTGEDSAAVQAIRQAYLAATGDSLFASRTANTLPDEVTFPLDLNSATAEQLTALPAIGPVLAARIIALRDSLGEFRDIQDLLRVPGIGTKRIESVRPLVTCGSAPGKNNTPDAASPTKISR